MRRRTLSAAMLALMFMSAGAHAGITVRFVGVERYSDADAGSSGSHKETISVLRRHLDALGSRYLGSGQDLAVEVLDIDLAGERLPRGARWDRRRGRAIGLPTRKNC